MELIFLDQHVAAISDPVEEILSFSHTDRFDRAGTFSLTLSLPLSDSLAEALACAAYILPRGDGAPSPFTDGRQTLCRIEKTVYHSEKQTVTLSGRLAESLLSDRFIARGTHAMGTVKSVIWDVVTKNAVSPYAGARGIPYLYMEKVPDFTDENGDPIFLDLHLGGAVLEDWLRELLAAYGASYRITYDEDHPDKPLLLSVYKSENRTHAQTKYAPVTFSTSLATLENATFTHDTERYRNYAFVAGEGSGDARVTVTLDRRKSPDEPLRELYIDARDLRSDDGDTPMEEEAYRALLLSRAQKRLGSQYTEILRIEGVGSPTFAMPLASLPQSTAVHAPQTVFCAGKDFSLGDMCDIALDAPRMALSERVTAIKTEVTDGAIATHALFGAEYPTLRELLNM